MEGQESFAEVINEDLGRARQVWATKFAFGILGGTGSKGAIRQRIQEARAELATIKDDDYTRDKIKERIGKLMGAAAVVRVGAPTRADQADLKFRIEAAVTAARAALRDGVVPGGGAALVACLAALDELKLSGDEAVGVRIMARALSEPMRAIAENAGIDPSPLIYFAAERGDRQTYDVVRRRWVDAREAGIVDPLSVLETALTAGTSAAMMAITTDVLIRHKKPTMATNP
jgi:chaperonin GroEL